MLVKYLYLNEIFFQMIQELPSSLFFFYNNSPLWTMLKKKKTYTNKNLSKEIPPYFPCVFKNIKSCINLFKWSEGQV